MIQVPPPTRSRTVTALPWSDISTIRNKAASSCFAIVGDRDGQETATESSPWPMSGPTPTTPFGWNWPAAFGGAAERFEAVSAPVLASGRCRGTVQDMAQYEGAMWSKGKQLLCQAEEGGFIVLAMNVRKSGAYESACWPRPRPISARSAWPWTDALWPRVRSLLRTRFALRLAGTGQLHLRRGPAPNPLRQFGQERGFGRPLLRGGRRGSPAARLGQVRRQIQRVGREANACQYARGGPKNVQAGPAAQVSSKSPLTGNRPKSIQRPANHKRNFGCGGGPTSGSALTDPSSAILASKRRPVKSPLRRTRSGPSSRCGR